MTEQNTTPAMPGEAAPLCYQVQLKPRRDRAVRRRHPWVYSGAIELIEGQPDARPGDLGRIVAAEGDVLGIAMINPAATLVARMLHFGQEPVDGPWMRARLSSAASLRTGLAGEALDAYRLINAEGDGLSGLIVDRYGDWLVVQCLAVGMARLQPWWLPGLIAQFGPRGIVERAARGAREVGLERQEGVLWGEAPPASLEIREENRRYAVDLLRGQKTGFYLDQRENRSLLSGLAAGKRVLDAYAYTGAFSVALGIGGAAQVVAIEASRLASERIGEAWRLNQLPDERLEVIRGSVPEILRNDTRSYDLIVLDPPPFARERGHRERAARGYKDINLWAMRRLAAGGWLATFSCSQHVGVDLFQKIVFGAALDAGVRLQWVRRLGAGRDHPVHLDHPQGEYLTGLLLRSLECE